MTHFTQPRGEVLPDGRNWFSLGMICLSDKGSCISLQSPAEEREALAMLDHGSRMTNCTSTRNQNSPASCPLVKKQALVDCQFCLTMLHSKQDVRKGKLPNESHPFSNLIFSWGWTWACSKATA